MSDMPKVIHANRYCEWLLSEHKSKAAGGTSYTRTDLVDELITLTNRVVNDHGSYLNMNSGDDDLADMLTEAIAAITGRG